MPTVNPGAQRQNQQKRCFSLREKTRLYEGNVGDESAGARTVSGNEEHTNIEGCAFASEDDQRALGHWDDESKGYIRQLKEWASEVDTFCFRARNNRHGVPLKLHADNYVKLTCHSSERVGF